MPRIQGRSPHHFDDIELLYFQQDAAWLKTATSKDLRKTMAELFLSQFDADEVRDVATALDRAANAARQ